MKRTTEISSLKHQRQLDGQREEKCATGRVKPNIIYKYTEIRGQDSPPKASCPLDQGGKCKCVELLDISEINDAKEILLKGLEKLEYRGYDSAGIAVMNENGIHVFKEKGRIADLRSIVDERCKANYAELVIHVGQLTVYQAK